MAMSDEQVRNALVISSYRERQSLESEYQEAVTALVGLTGCPVAPREVICALYNTNDRDLVTFLIDIGEEHLALQVWLTTDKKLASRTVVKRRDGRIEMVVDARSLGHRLGTDQVIINPEVYIGTVFPVVVGGVEVVFALDRAEKGDISETIRFRRSVIEFVKRYRQWQ